MANPVIEVQSGLGVAEANGNTIILFASALRDGNTGKLADAVAAELAAPVIDLGALHISGFDYAHGNRLDDFEPLMDKVLACRHIVFASPVYWYGMAPAMKTFIDRITDFLDLPDLHEKGRKLRGKNAYVICTSNSEQADDVFLQSFSKTFDYLGLLYGGAIHAECVHGLNEKGIAHDINKFTRLFEMAS